MTATASTVDMRRRRSIAGFTLIEILVTLVIVALGLLGLGDLYGCRRVAGHDRNPAPDSRVRQQRIRHRIAPARCLDDIQAGDAAMSAMDFVRARKVAANRGFTLLELMISLTIGLIVLGGM